MEDVVKALSILKKYVDQIESKDPQLKAIKKVVQRHGLASLGVVVGNALVSYRLKGTGEEYWTEFGEFFSSHEPTVENLIKFIKKSRYNVALKEQKVRRVERVKEFLERVSANPLRYKDLDALRQELARVLGAKGTEKTVVFASKMAYYAFKAAGVEAEGDVPVPVDSRVATVTCASGLVEGTVEEIMGAKRDEAVRTWARAAREAGMKTLNLDAVIWLPARGLRRALCRGVEAGRELFASNLKGLGVEEAEEVSALLIKKACC
ncbi:N-glycosylase/DNA lyase [Ignicoccus hospitalis]|uniref:DNA-(Apurinic or apyrimidinic site) lyase n=1 Tax=Ignicoccus hospitalis (strain KIN4/I / DSM 18386 / JCM 14125) TaxID=453591 RepID=A8AC97_IGNH4|nr:N-glycosylase/DNA lyase [Ignicoccus hospitalis]ABU82549.1 DNA-(apurinic or apyrimidinic site) lyase [Ignicoccus hospitalis KIN4/I]HIH90714.1 N-glycosylase/DNA lyase [Desulfurococcaceae archaeon]